MSRSSFRRPLILLALVFALCLVGFAAWQYGIHSLKTQIVQSLGSRGEVREIHAGLTGVEILDLRIRSQEGGSWPGDDELRARRILIVPDFFSFMSARPSIDNIFIEGANVVLLRTKDGKVRIVPSLLDKPSEQPSAAEGVKSVEDKKDGAGGMALDIGQIIVSDGAIEFHDQSIRATPVKLRIEQIEATVGKLRLPELAGNTSLKIDAIAKSPRRNGKLAINGSFNIAAQESKLVTKLRDVDLITLQPYLIKATETGVQRGALDLDLDSSITGGKLRAPGAVTLSDLELSDGSKFMGLPRSAVIGLLKDKNGRISMKFVIEGDINDPRFSLNEHLAMRFGLSLAGELGVSLESLVKGVGHVGSDSAKGIGKSIGRLLGK
ncbi:hypothetical protein AGMMS50256_29400 [Betaproteobacteria bacterium]|nr:hypothetical protein AGMMS50256_29400 [Betaproteobacteria bacterium]